jgi:tRNA threonylcarbamoyl adenosine modification protein YeaZ
VLLALDSSTDAVSVAIHHGSTILAERTVDAARRHAEVLMPLVDEVVAASGAVPADLSAIAAGIGPGGFTGLRVGLVSARTLALALQIPCHGVMSLDAIAYAALTQGFVDRDHPFGVAIDARRREVFWARYEAGRRVGDAQADRPGDIAQDVLRGLPVVGDAAATYPEAFTQWIQASPTAAAIARIASDPACGFATMPAAPVYVRRPDAAEPGARKPATAPRDR